MRSGRPPHRRLMRTRRSRHLRSWTCRWGNPAEAVTILTRLAGRTPGDSGIQRLLAQAQLANGQTAEAVQTLEEARAADPKDSELTFTLAAAYLRAGKVDAAAPLFAAVKKARPGPETDVLIGRTYRDYGFYDRARASLERALKQDPRTRRAHYYLGTLAFMDEGVLRLEEAINEFRAELTLAPRDPATNLRLGMALVEAQRPAEALPSSRRLQPKPSRRRPRRSIIWGAASSLWIIPRTPSHPSVERSRWLLRPRPTRPESAAFTISLRSRCDEQVSRPRRRSTSMKRSRHRRAAPARSGSDSRSTWRTRRQPEAPSQSRVVALESPFAPLSVEERAEIERRIKTLIARANLNLGVMHAQAQRFGRAAECFEQAAAVDPEFPQVQYSLGVAYFNAQQFDKAARAARAGLRSRSIEPRSAPDAVARVVQRRGVRQSRRTARGRSRSRKQSLAAVHVRAGAGPNRSRG